MTRSTNGMSSRNTALVGGLLAVFLAAPAKSQTREGFYLTPSFSAVGIYDDNLFFTSSRENEQAFFVRFSPGIEAEHLGARLTLLGSYSLQSEVFPDRPELTTALAGQRASTQLGYRLTPSTALSFHTGYAKTQTPSEHLLLQTGLVTGRQPLESYTAGLGFTRRISSQNAWDAGYNFGYLDFGEILRSRSHSVTTGWTTRRGLNITGDLRYTFHLFFFDQSLTALLVDDNSSSSHVFTAGWTHRITPKTTITLRGGPRLSEGLKPTSSPVGSEFRIERSFSAEALASIHHKREQVGFSLTYARSQHPLFVQSGFVNTESFTVTAGYDPHRSLRFTASPGLYRNTLGDSVISGYRANLDAELKMAEWIFLQSSYAFTLQEGGLDFSGTFSDEGIFRRNIFRIGLYVKYPFRVD